MKASRSWLALAALLGALLLGGRGAQASIIPVDPGPVGGAVASPIAFSLPAASSVIDLVFSDMKHVEIAAGDTIGFFLSHPAAPALERPYTVFLSDALGLPIPGTGTSGTLNLAGFMQSPASPLVFHDIHFASSGADDFPAGDYELFITPVTGTQPLVGQWTVPEPASLLLMGLGLAGLSLVTRRRAPA